MEIMTTSFNLNNRVQANVKDIELWMNQFVEHALFLSQLLDPIKVPGLQEEAHEIHEQLKGLLIIGGVERVAKLLNYLFALLVTIHNKTDHNINLKISSDDFHDLVKHMMLEQSYFTRLVAGKITIKEEVEFWAEESAGHLTLISHELPEGTFKHNIQQLVQFLKSTPADSNMIAQVVQGLEIEATYTQELLDSVIKGKIKVDKAMLEHEMRESNWGLYRLKYFVGNM